MSAAIEIRGLDWQLSPEFRLQISELDLPAGQCSLLLGPSASGKSTLLSLLGRVDGAFFGAMVPTPRSGEIRVHLPGQEPPLDLLAMSERALMRARIRGRLIGFVFQREGLFAGRSAMENVTWALRAGGMSPAEAEARGETVLRDVNLEPKQAVATLSGGERKRLALARALAPDPPILLLDEPLTGLDPQALGGLLALLERVAATPGRTVVMVTHQREDIERLGEHIVLMKRGSVVQSGPRDAMNDALGAFLAGQGLGGEGQS